MTVQWRISIRSKILLVLSAVVIAALSFYLFLASRIFYEDKTLLIYELSQTQVRTLGTEMETYFRGLVDRLRARAALGAASTDLLLGSDPEIVRIGLLQKGEPETILGTWPGALGPDGTDPGLLDKIHGLVPIPFDQVMAKKVWVRNATLPGDSPPLMILATAARSVSGQPVVIYADISLAHVLDAFAKKGIARAYLIDSEKHILAHAEPSRVVAQGDAMASDPLIQAAFGSKLRSEMRTFREDDQDYVGAFFQVGMGDLVVASRVESAEAFAAARLLLRKSLMYALVVVTGAFLVALFLSHSLTEPIERLVEATRRIAQGDFSLPVSVSSHDELAVLAASFNSMTSDLRVSRDKIEEYSRTLEQRVVERTERLEAQNVAIKEAQEALVRTTRLASVGEVAGRAAHEVLNPLTNISTRLERIQSQDAAAEAQDLRLFSEIIAAWRRDLAEKGAPGLFAALGAPSSAQPGKTLLEEDLENLQSLSADAEARAKRHRDDILALLAEAARISRIVNGMRQLTRVSSSRRELDLHPFLDSALATFTDLLAKNQIELQKGYCSGEPRILADRDELIQVLSNLFSNSLHAIQLARRAGPPGSFGTPARISVTTRIPAGGKGKIEIRVSDNGPGIPAESHEQVFEPSFTTKPSEEGTGLGLSIARRFIRAHDGEIRIEKSAPGVETTFLIELPEVLNG